MSFASTTTQRVWIASTVAAATGIAVANLSALYNRGMDWDLAFFLAPFRLAHISRLPFHPVMDLPFRLYSGFLWASDDPLFSLQAFYFVVVLLGAVLNGLLFHLLFRRRSLSLLAGAVYPLFPVVQNLSTYYEDNLLKLTCLLGILVLIFAHRDRRHCGSLYLTCFAASFLCLVSTDAFVWMPFIAALMAWRFWFRGEPSLPSLLRFCAGCAALGLGSFVLIALFHDLLGPFPFGTTFQTVGRVFSGVQPDYAPPAGMSRASYFLFAPLEPIFGAQHAIDAVQNYMLGSPVDPNPIAPAAAAIPDEVALLKWITVGWLAGHIALFVATIAVTRRRGDSEASSFALLMLAGFVLFYGFNYFYNDAPNERYDHFVVLLPLVLYTAALLVRSLAPSLGKADRLYFLTRLRAEHVLIAFIALGLVRFAAAPRGVSLLFHLRADYPGHFSEYYFSLRELAGTSHAELAFLAGYRPLHIVNLKQSELGLFSPYYYLDKRSPDAITRHLSQPGTDAYLSPDMRSHLRSHPATKRD